MIALTVQLELPAVGRTAVAFQDRVSFRKYLTLHGLHVAFGVLGRRAMMTGQIRGSMAGLALVTLLGGSAAAAPIKFHSGSTVRVALQGKREAGIGLRPHAGGWRLELTATAGAVADVLDVTEGAAGAKWTVAVDDGAVFFDDETFAAGHAYRVLVRHGSESLGAALIYLYPPSVASRHKVTFDDADASGGAGEGPTIVKKPTL